MNTGLKRVLTVALVVNLAILAGCERPEEVSEDEQAVAVVRDMPVDTTPQAVWAHLESENYAEAWAFWPERAAYYQGSEPHGVLLSTYLNQAALSGLLDLQSRNDGDALPFGSMIVKENFSPDSSLVSVTIMYKAKNYNPDHNDWFWMKRLADGTVEAAGRIQGCIDCHAEAAEARDYLLTALSEEIQSHR